MGNDLKEILVTAEDMDRRLGEMAEQIDRDYAGEELLIVGVLRGAVMVMADLSRKLHTPSRWTGWPFRLTDRAPRPRALCVSSRTLTRTWPVVTC